MVTQQRYIQLIGEENDGQRADNYLLAKLPGVPKGRVYRAFRGGEVRVNGGRVKPDHRLKKGDQVRVPPLKIAEKPEVFVSEKTQKSVCAAVFHEGENYKVINKPPGMSVHTGSGVSSGVIEAIVQHEKDPHWKLVHRLDKQTSGCLLVARQGAQLRSLSQQFREKTVQKVYLAVVVGRWRHGEIKIDAPLEKHQLEGGERMVVVDHGGVPAVTYVEPLFCSGELSLLRVTLDTGRTHQIRVHTAYLGHPILGDQKYGDKRLARQWQKQYKDSLFLHAAKLQFDVADQRLEASAALPSSWRLLPIWSTISGMPELALGNRLNTV